MNVNKYILLKNTALDSKLSIIELEDSLKSYTQCER